MDPTTTIVLATWMALIRMARDELHLTILYLTMIIPGSVHLSFLLLSYPESWSARVDEWAVPPDGPK